jgi:hypothetical protein
MSVPIAVPFLFYSILFYLRLVVWISGGVRPWKKGTKCVCVCACVYVYENVIKVLLGRRRPTFLFFLSSLSVVVVAVVTYVHINQSTLHYDTIRKRCDVAHFTPISTLSLRFHFPLSTSTLFTNFI